MPIRPKSLDDMIRDVIATLQSGSTGGRPGFTLLLGSGFSFPIIPTPAQMLKGDIAWWRYCKEKRYGGPFRDRSDAITDGSAKPDDVTAYEREFWKSIQAKAA